MVLETDRFGPQPDTCLFQKPRNIVVTTFKRLELAHLFSTRYCPLFRTCLVFIPLLFRRNLLDLTPSPTVTNKLLWVLESLSRGKKTPHFYLRSQYVLWLLHILSSLSDWDQSEGDSWRAAPCARAPSEEICFWKDWGLPETDQEHWLPCWPGNQQRYRPTLLTRGSLWIQFTCTGQRHCSFSLLTNHHSITLLSVDLSSSYLSC